MTSWRLRQMIRSSFFKDLFSVFGYVKNMEIGEKYANTVGIRIQDIQITVLLKN